MKGFTSIFLVILLSLLIVGSGTYIFHQESPKITSSPSPNSTFTPTASPVSLPSPSSSQSKTVTKQVGEKEGYFLIQKINQGSVDGLWYSEYPVATNVGTSKTLKVGDKIGYPCEGRMEQLTKIDANSQTITFEEITMSKPPYGCPLCLASNTLISTLTGEVKVTNLKVGTLVWTVDKNGKRVAKPVAKLASMRVPSEYRIIHIVLADKREAFISSPHPTDDGRTIGQLKVGDTYDHSTIVKLEAYPYWDTRTYDLLPDSDTGYYWANGIPVGSTLKSK